MIVVFPVLPVRCDVSLPLAALRVDRSVGALPRWVVSHASRARSGVSLTSDALRQRAPKQRQAAEGAGGSLAHAGGHARVHQLLDALPRCVETHARRVRSGVSLQLDHLRGDHCGRADGALSP